MEGDNPFKPNNPNTLRPTPSIITGQAEVQEPKRNNPTRQIQHYSTPTTQPSIPQTPSDLAGMLSEAAKANAEFWANQCMGTQHASQGISPSTARMPSSTYTTDLPLLPMPKALQTVKRGREDVPVQAKAGQCVTVRNLPHAATRGDIQDLFGQYEWKSIRMPSRPAGYAVVCLASVEEAGRAVRELSGMTIRGSKIMVQFEEHMIPELPILRDEGVLAKRVKTEEQSEIREVIRAPVDATRAGIDPAIEAEKKDMTAVKKTTPTTQKVERGNRYFLRIADLAFEANEKDLGEFLAGINVKTITLPTFLNTTCPTGYAILELPTSSQQKSALQTLARRKFQGRYLTVTLVENNNNGEEDEDGSSVLEPPPLPKHVSYGNSRSREEMFREAVLSGEGGLVNRRVLREWFSERGVWLDL